MNPHALRSAVFFLFFLAAGISASAQNQSQEPDAHLFGSLLDTSGAGVAAVNVTAQLEGNAAAQLWKANSATDGAYSLAIPPGRYRVTFERSPFLPRDFVVDLSANQQRKLDLTLNLE